MAGEERPPAAEKYSYPRIPSYPQRQVFLQKSAGQQMHLRCDVRAAARIGSVAATITVAVNTEGIHEVLGMAIGPSRRTRAHVEAIREPTNGACRLG